MLTCQCDSCQLLFIQAYIQIYSVVYFLIKGAKLTDAEAGAISLSRELTQGKQRHPLQAVL